MDLLEVPSDMLQEHGAVSAATARAMALGAAAPVSAPTWLWQSPASPGPREVHRKSRWAPSIMGLASPQGVKTRHCLFYGSREEIKILTAQTALDWLRLELQ